MEPWFGENQSTWVQTPLSKHFQAYLQNFPEREAVPLGLARGSEAGWALETREQSLDFAQENSQQAEGGHYTLLWLAEVTLGLEDGDFWEQTAYHTESC